MSFEDMTYEKFKNLQEKSLKYILLSLIHRTNMLDELSDDDKEIVLNNVFNVMLNALKPDAALIWNDLILSFSQKYQSMKNVDDIMQELKNMKEEP